MNHRLLLCLATLTASVSYAAQPTLLLLDTDGNDPYQYHTLQLLAENAGFKTESKNLYQFLDNPTINTYDAVFFMISGVLPFNEDHEISQLIIKTIKDFSAQNNKLIGIIFPEQIHIKQHYLDLLKPFFLAAGVLDIPHKTQKKLFKSVRSLAQIASTNRFYDTRLFLSDKNKKPAPRAHVLPTIKTVQATPLPMHMKNFSKNVQPLLPNGLLITNPASTNMLFAGTFAACNFADIAENFRYNPLDAHLRTALLKALQQTLFELRIAYQTNNISPTINQPSPPLPEQLTSSFIHKKKQKAENHIKSTLNPNYDWVVKDGISCAWVGFNDFFGQDDVHKKLEHAIASARYKNKLIRKLVCWLSPHDFSKEVERIALQNGIRFVYDTGFNMLWIEMLPEWYLSENGIKQNHIKQYSSQVKRFGHELKQLFAKTCQPLPKIFIGMNLTSNFANKEVKNPVQNLFGRTYSKIPSPFDIEHFWQPEVLDVFERFYKFFHDALPIDGVFLDFEMYHAQTQASNYTDMMDFSETAWNVYCKHSPSDNPGACTSVQERFSYLQEHQQFTEYFSVLEKQAQTIGRMIKQHIRTINPQLLFAAYAQTLPNSWFYRGIMAGLSSEKEPLILATFNNDYYRHHDWLQSRNIFLLHGSAIMLSKLQQPQDFNLITDTYRNHAFAWFNKPSRMIYDYNKKELKSAWWALEASPLPVQVLANKIQEKIKSSICKK